RDGCPAKSPLLRREDGRRCPESGRGGQASTNRGLGEPRGNRAEGARAWHSPFSRYLGQSCSHNFGIREEHLIRWAGIQPAYLRKIGDIRVNNITASLLSAGVWVHRDQPGRRDEWEDGPAFCLELSQGIAVYPVGTPTAPRLPVLGLRGLEWARL